jgi:uncharacterized protein (DUF2235 family)
MSKRERIPKRLIVTCDGTWVNSDNGFTRNSWMPWNREVTLTTPSNVTRICRALVPETDDGVPQIVYYQGGLGSADSFWSYLFGGFLGEGISENIREAYAFLCNVRSLHYDVVSQSNPDRIIAKVMKST